MKLTSAGPWAKCLELTFFMLNIADKPLDTMQRTVLFFFLCSNWICPSCYMDFSFSKLLDGIVKIERQIFLSFYMDLLKIDAWIFLNCYMDLSKIRYGFFLVGSVVPLAMFHILWSEPLRSFQLVATPLCFRFE